jgi:hypothetical protein
VTPPEPAPTTPDRARLAEIAAVRERFHELLEDENPHHPWAIRYREKQQMGATVDLERAERMADWAWDTNQDDLARTLDDLLAALRAAEAGREAEERENEVLRQALVAIGDLAHAVGWPKSMGAAVDALNAIGREVRQAFTETDRLAALGAGAAAAGEAGDG